MEQHFDELFYLRGEGATLQRWLSALPAELVRSRPRLLLAQAPWSLTGGRAEAVGAPLDAAERAFTDAADEPFEPSAGRAASLLVNVPATIALYRAYLAELRGDAEGAASFAVAGPGRDRRRRADAGFHHSGAPGPGRVAARPAGRG